MTKKQPWEALAESVERALRRLAGPEVGEATWGDLMEMARERPRRRGRAADSLWISLQALRLMASLADWSRLLPGRWFEEVLMDGWNDRQRRLAAIGGALAASPAALLVVSGMVYVLAEGGAWAQTLDATLFRPEGLFYRIVLHPAVILGGLALAVALNLLPLMRMRLERGTGSVSATIGLRLRPLHLGIAAAGLALLMVVLAYAFSENFVVVAREGAEALHALGAAVG